MRMTLEYYGHVYLRPGDFLSEFRRPWMRTPFLFPDYRQSRMGRSISVASQLRQMDRRLVMEPYERFDRGVPLTAKALFYCLRLPDSGDFRTKLTINRPHNISRKNFENLIFFVHRTLEWLPARHPGGRCLRRWIPRPYNRLCYSN